MATISAKRAGKVRMSNNTSEQAYKSGSNVMCNGCDALIRAGEKYTRAKIMGGGAATYPMCHECRPFTEYTS